MVLGNSLSPDQTRREAHGHSILKLSTYKKQDIGRMERISKWLAPLGSEGQPRTSPSLLLVAPNSLHNFNLSPFSLFKPIFYAGNPSSQQIGYIREWLGSERLSLALLLLESILNNLPYQQINSPFHPLRILPKKYHRYSQSNQTENQQEVYMHCNKPMINCSRL